jgi:RNA polymerase sigma-70 factor (ECF subfamily)
MNNGSHEELMLQVQRGNVAAFELLFEQYRLRVFNFLYRMLNGERGPAEDLLLEVFVKIYDARKYYEPKAKFSTWLFTIVRNHCLNFIMSRRYRQGRQTMSLEAMAEERRGKAGAEALLDPAAQTIRGTSAIGELLEQAIARLPDEYKEVVILHAVEGMSHQDVAEVLKMNPATVRTNYHRARTILRERIGISLNRINIKTREGGHDARRGRQNAVPPIQSPHSLGLA